jgi:hypothetical protein
MGAVQLEIRLPGMVKCPQPPVVRVVAGAAIRPEGSLVCVTLAVAVDAAGFGALVVGVAVTALTRHNVVQADEREAGEAVVESHGLIPANLGVAGGAVGAELSAVDIVPVVAGHAGGPGLYRIHGAGVAAPAANVLVRAE